MKEKKRLLLHGLLIGCLVLILVFASLSVRCEHTQFSDTSPGDWFYEDVCYVQEHGLMQGTQAHLFSPHSVMSRGMLVTVLWRMEDMPAEEAPAFSDVAPGAYYADAVAWAAEKNIVKGTTASTFSPDSPVTREQLAAIFYRYAACKQYDMTASSSVDAYKDKEQVSAYAVPALCWALGTGLIQGTSKETLSPQATATRCQTAAILHRFCLLTENTPAEEKTPVPAAGGTSSGSEQAASSTHSHTEKEKNDAWIQMAGITAAPGDTVQIPVTIQHNPGILGMSLTVQYDESVLSLQKAENGEAFSGVLDLTVSQTLKSGARFLWDGIALSDADIKDGEILTLYGKISDLAPKGTYPLSFSFEDGDIVDNDLCAIALHIEPGYITVVDAEEKGGD